MAFYATKFDKPYAVVPKTGWSQKIQSKGTTMVVEMSPEDLPKLDPANIATYVSPANASRVHRRIAGGSRAYWGAGVSSNEELTRLLHDGWPEGAEKILAMSAKIRDLIPQPVGPRRRLKWMDQGDSIDMARVYGGQLDTAWRSNPRQRQQAPRVISIDADVGHNCNVTADSLMWAGVAAVALTDALESAGYRVELFSTSASYLHNGVALSRLVAKRASDPVSATRIAALVALPATFRYYHLMSWTAHPEAVGDGYGLSARIAEPLEAALNEGIIDGTEIILSESLSMDSAITEVTRAIATLEGVQDAGEGTMA